MFSSPIQIVNFTISLVCSLITIINVIPQGLKTIWSRNTSGLSKYYFIFALVSCSLWLALGIFSICTPFVLNEYKDLDFKTKLVQGLNAGLASIITNTVGIIIYIIILFIKINNLKKAKKLNISEIDYCKQILETRKHKAENL